MAKKDYEQTEMDTRSEDTRLITSFAAQAIESTLEVVKAGEPTAIHNRHEAYGVAAENLIKVSAMFKSVKGDVDQLLATLADPNYPAVEAVSAIRNGCGALTAATIKMGAEMERTMNDLYIAETKDPEPTPIEELVSASSDGFEEADAVEETEE